MATEQMKERPKNNVRHDNAAHPISRQQINNLERRNIVGAFIFCDVQWT